MTSMHKINSFPFYYEITKTNNDQVTWIKRYFKVISFMDLIKHQGNSQCVYKLIYQGL